MEQTKLEGADDITDACIASQRNLEKLDTLEDHCKDIKRGSPSPVLHSNGHLWVQWSVWAVSHRRDVAAPTGQTKGKEGNTGSESRDRWIRDRYTEKSIGMKSSCECIR